VIVYADVDGLKGINDGSGHAAGDRALITVARTLRSCMRESDVVARVGGDEFAAIARDATHGHVDALIGRVRDALRAAPAGRGGDRLLSVSIGAVHYGGHGELSLPDLMARADQALYREKRRRSAGLVARPAVSTL
jgi:diguanylate cyclase (GGDEF)-like protein